MYFRKKETHNAQALTDWRSQEWSRRDISKDFPRWPPVNKFPAARQQCKSQTKTSAPRVKLRRFEFQTIFDEMKIHCKENNNTLKLCGCFGIRYGFEKQNRLVCLCRTKNKMAQTARTKQTVWVWCALWCGLGNLTGQAQVHRIQTNTPKKRLFTTHTSIH